MSIKLSGQRLRQSLIQSSALGTVAYKHSATEAQKYQINSSGNFAQIQTSKRQLIILLTLEFKEKHLTNLILRKIKNFKRTQTDQDPIQHQN